HLSDRLDRSTFLPGADDGRGADPAVLRLIGGQCRHQGSTSLEMDHLGVEAALLVEPLFGRDQYRYVGDVLLDRASDRGRDQLTGFFSSCVVCCRVWCRLRWRVCGVLGAAVVGRTTAAAGRNEAQHEQKEYHRSTNP